MTANFIKDNAQSISKVNYSILISEKEGGYQAMWGLPDCQVFAKTRDAIKNLH